VLVFGLSLSSRTFASAMLQKGVRLRLALDSPVHRKAFFEFEEGGQAELLLFDFADPHSVARVFKGIETCHLVPDNGFDFLQGKLPVIFDAMKESKLKYLVFGLHGTAGMQHLQTDLLPPALQDWLGEVRHAERVAQSLGIPVAILRLSATAEQSAFLLGESVKKARKLCFPDSSSNWITVKDLMNCFEEVVFKVQKHAGATYTLTGLKPFTLATFANLVSKTSASLHFRPSHRSLVGERVETVPQTQEEFAERCISEFQFSTKFAHAMSALFFAQAATGSVTTDVDFLLGHPAQSIDDWLTENAHFFLSDAPRS
jgi:uncharacterized protein YbjT (DUF2867 family)